MSEARNTEPHARGNRSSFQHVQRVVQWAIAHKLKALLIVFGLFVVVELLTIPWFDVPRLRTESPTETALMRQRREEAEREGRNFVVRHRWVPLSKIPRHVVNAVVVAEDGTFWEHGGFDWYEFKESLKKNWERKRAVRGASTITQQLAKNLYLSTSKDPIRKLKEWIITLLLEAFLDKERILELYLNIIEWGRGVFGIEAAAQTYFHRPASAVTLEQAIRLAVVIPSPLKHRPTDNTRWVAFRRNVVLQRMQGRRYFDAEEPEEEDTQQEQSKENQSSPVVIPPSPADTGEVSNAVASDSTDIDRGPP
ncbi:MAG: monofunctional biosynthetic peptidoglycan transglycosylase [Ignavibacteria bacterium]